MADSARLSQSCTTKLFAIGNEPSFRQKRLIDIGIVPVFDSPEQFAEYLNGLIHESGFRPR